ncbi:hypothetical protein SAMN02745751_02716 [Dethiosulfatibacter aminovorans DSM 17477]|uniref:Uncharacterized protein n=1 Tax=Dethiosulfatibacter aminovorans DSM 17477 TaxID=1121476 RepID=A0A1M6JUY5_9FIRM|nr:hypothetical protein [Dethiosulfatibacter aminovorans]SHJ50535.1 hypothetical protein SAMN02745751_02716 [Dethiosulfatibacter aminovorans DSM 17477]
MKIKELKKLYKYDDRKNAFVVDVQLEDYRDAYSEWDFSPFTNRDLDEDLTDYLLECSYEIPIKYDMIIDFHILNQSKNKVREEKSVIGMHNYFGYQLRKLKKRKIRVVRDMVTFLIIGSILLLAGFYLDEFFKETLLLSVLSEGFFIGGWVMIWEMFSAWLFDLKEVRSRFKHFERLNDSTIVYSYGKD